MAAPAAVEVLPESVLEHSALSGGKKGTLLPWCPEGKGAGEGTAPSVTSSLSSHLAAGHGAETEAAGRGPQPSYPAAGGALDVMAPGRSTCVQGWSCTIPTQGKRGVPRERASFRAPTERQRSLTISSVLV